MNIVNLLGQTSGTIGTNAEMINKGSWETSPQPHLPKSKKEYKVLFRFGFQFQNFRFLCDYLMDPETKETCFFIYPHNKEFYPKTIVFSDKVQISKYWQRDIYNNSIPNKNLQSLFSKFRESNIFYSTDLCGTDFKQVIDFSIKR